MTKEQLYNMDFDEAVECLYEERNDITSYDALIGYVKENIDNDNIGLAVHILQAIYEGDESIYYKYDYSMGRLETPTAITTIEDLEEFCEEEK